MDKRGVTVWFTGLSGAGKTTIAKEVAAYLARRGLAVERLDGDVLRQSFTRDLGFSKADRQKNIERVTFVAKMLTRHGVIVLAAFISPYQAVRNYSRREIGNFLEVYVRAPMEVLLERDVKGLYRKALAGEIKNFTGVDDPYEEPEQPDLICHTHRETIAESAGKVVDLLVRHGYLDALFTRPSSEPDAGSGAQKISLGAGGPRGGGPLAAAARGELAAGNGAALVLPHGGPLVDRELTGCVREEGLERAARLLKVVLDRREQADLAMIADGALSPLTGFMGRADYESVLTSMRLADGLVWTLPVALAVSEDEARAIELDGEIALTDEEGTSLALMQVTDKYRYDQGREAELVYGTRSVRHPGVARLYRQGEVLLGGPIWLLNRPAAGNFPAYDLSPAAVRRAFAQRGWRTVVAFQTRNPIHRAHEYLQKVALESVDGLLVHPLMGATKEDDLPPAVRLQTYEAILDAYYPKKRVLLAAFPAAMRYAGPREAVFHAISRKNYGCTHFIVGRDHAGVGNYYGTYDAQRIFDQFTPAELGINIFKFDHSFYCRACGGMATAKTCPHDAGYHMFLSGTRVRELLSRGELLPPEFTRPEVARILLSQGVPAAGSVKS